MNPILCLLCFIRFYCVSDGPERGRNRRSTSQRLCRCSQPWRIRSFASHHLVTRPRKRLRAGPTGGGFSSSNRSRSCSKADGRRECVWRWIVPSFHFRGVLTIKNHTEMNPVLCSMDFVRLCSLCDRREPEPQSRCNISATLRMFRAPDAFEVSHHLTSRHCGASGLKPWDLCSRDVLFMRLLARPPPIARNCVIVRNAKIEKFLRFAANLARGPTGARHFGSANPSQQSRFLVDCRECRRAREKLFACDR